MPLSMLIQKLRRSWRDGRNRSILTYFVTSLSGRSIGILCQLVQVPLALHYLGKEAFGVWVTMASIQYLMSFSDFGIGMGAQNQITEALGIGDTARARKVFMTTLVFLCAVAGLLAIAGIPAFLLFHWGAIFKLKDPALIRTVPGGMIAFMALSCVNFPLGIGRRLAFASQQAWLDNVTTTSGSVLGLAGVFLGTFLHLAFRDYVIITSVPSVLAAATLLLYQYFRLDWLRGRGIWFDRAVLSSLLNLGLLFGVQQLCNLVLFGGPPLLISTLLGAAAITPFNLVQRIFNVFQMFQNAFLLPLWPAYADAKAKGDWHWMAKTLRRSMVATVWVAVVPMIGIAFIARPIIRLWTGVDTAVPAAGLVVSLLLWNIVVALQQPLGFLLAGVSEVKRNTLYSVLTTITAAVLMFVLTPRLGINGIVLSLVIGNGTFCLCGGAYEVWKYLRRVKAGTQPRELAEAPSFLDKAESAP